MSRPISLTQCDDCTFKVGDSKYGQKIDVRGKTLSIDQNKDFFGKDLHLLKAAYCMLDINSPMPTSKSVDSDTNIALTVEGWDFTIKIGLPEFNAVKKQLSFDAEDPVIFFAIIAMRLYQIYPDSDWF